MDQGHHSSRLAGEGSVSSEECRSCAISLEISNEGAGGSDHYVAEDIDENVVVVSSSLFAGLVVIPRLHAGGLEELSVVHRAGGARCTAAGDTIGPGEKSGDDDQSRRENRTSRRGRSCVLRGSAERPHGSEGLPVNVSVSFDGPIA